MAGSAHFLRPASANLYDDYRSEINIFLSFCTVVQYISDTVGLLIFSCSPDYFKECIAATFI